MVVFPKPVMKFMVGYVLLLAELKLRLAAVLPNLDQRKHQLLRGWVGGCFHSFFAQNYGLISCMKRCTWSEGYV